MRDTVVETKLIRALVITPAGETVPIDFGVNVCTVGTSTGKRMQAVGIYTLSEAGARMSIVMHPDEALALAQAISEAAAQAGGSDV